MIQTIRVQPRLKDLKAEGLLHEIKTTLPRLSITDIRTTRVYRLEGITASQAKFLKNTLFCENITQISTLNKKLINNTPNLIEIGYKPGVMNPQVQSIVKSAKDLGINLIAADSSTEYGFYGKLDKKEITSMVEKLLINKIVERIITQTPMTLLIKGSPGKTSVINIRNMNDSELAEVSKDKLFLNLDEMKVIQNYFRKIKRDPTDCELETIAQTWSEHSVHKTFKAKIFVEGIEKKPLIERLKKEALKHNKNIVSAFVDNSGVMDFYDGWAISGKGETHNSPSAIEPYGGAMTGSGGVFRDIVGTGKGGKVLISTDIFCLANPNLPSSKLPPGSLPPDYLLKRLVAGVKDYGNRMGIPTNNGSFHFHNDFRAKPTVLVGAYGILPKKSAQIGKPKTGDIIISIGGRIGRDGIHGATFSSGEMTDKTITTNVQSVQIGNAIEEKRTFDAIIEARDKNLIHAIQDCGGGGLSSAIGELGQDLGVNVQLKNAALKYQGLSPWEIWLSESQERMILVIPKNKMKRFVKICQKYNVETSILGVFDGSKRLRVYYGKKLVCNLDMKFLHYGLPQRKMIAKKPIEKETPSRRNLLGKKDTLMPSTELGWIRVLQRVLSHGNVCSKEPIVRLYDHTVQGTNVLQPFGGELMDAPNDAAVTRPLLDKPYGMIVAHGLNPILNRIDPYWGSIWAATEAISNYVSVGGDYKNSSLINNYISPYPNEESLWALDKSVDAVIDFMNVTKIPVISGKDSLSSTYRGSDGTVIEIPPVLCISVFGKIPDVGKTVSSDFKKEGSIICLLGKMDWGTMGGSVYFDVNRILGENVPKVDLRLLRKTLDALTQAIQKGKVLACHDISEGGLITSIFEMCVGGNIGAKLHLGRWRGIDLDSSEVNSRPDFVLFNETPGCFIAELENKYVAKKLFKNIPYVILGNTQREKVITVSKNKKKLFRANLEGLKKSWQEPMKKYFG